MLDADLSATLAGIRERQEWGDLREAAFKDVPLLLTALEAVLKLADEAEPGLTAACTCYDCEACSSSDPGYEDYKPHPGRVLAWKLDPAKVRETITAELTGKETGDGAR